MKKRVIPYITWTNLALFLILTLAIFLRFYQLDKQIWWMGGDDARDMLVVRHIADYGETIRRGPLALGGLNSLKNSPVYYYFVAFFWFLTNSAKGVMYLWASLFTLPVLLAYLMVKKIANEKSALLTSLIFAINPYMINVSKNLTQPHLAVIFSTFFIYFLFNYLSSKKRKLLGLLGMIGVASLAFHFHYNIILVFPSFFFLIVIFYCRLNSGQKKAFSQNSVLPILFALVLFTSWLVLTYTVKIFDQFVFLKINSALNNKNFPSVFSTFWDVFLLILRLIWGKILVKPMIVPSATFLVFLIFRKRSLPNSLFKESLNYLLFILSSVFLIILYHGYVEDTYFLFFLPVVLILLSLALTLLLEQIKNYAWPIIVAVIFLMLWSTINFNFGNFFPLPVYEKKRLLAEIIANDYSILYPSFNKDTEQPKILLSWDSQVFIYMSDSWGNPGIWFHLEDIFQQQLVELTNHEANYRPIIDNPQVIYGICHYHHDYEKISNCLNYFLDKYPIYRSDIYQLYGDQEVALFRAEVKMSLKTPLVNSLNY